MPLSRRDVLLQLSTLLATPLARIPDATWHALSTPAADPLLGTIAAYQAGRLRGDYTALEITRRALERAQTRGMALNAIDLLTARTALDEARASDRRLRQRAWRGPLDGVPLFAKSIYDMAGTPTTASSAVWARLFPDAMARDAREVDRLRRAGAVLLGKTAADDFAYRGNGTSSLTGQVRNPHDPSRRRTPGGSSAGAAVVVATGMAFGALGTDDGGSNRIPAQFTGVVGMKPTFGLVPRTGVIPTWPYLDTHGPLSRFVADAALMLDVLAGPDPTDALALADRWTGGALANLRDDALAGARLGVVALHAPTAQMSSASVQQFERALADCRAAGAMVKLFDPPVHRANVREQFAAAAARRGDVAPDPNSPTATVNALRRYVEHQGGDPRRVIREGLAVFRSFYDVIPSEWRQVEPMLDAPYEQDPAGVSFARARTEVVGRLADAMRAQRVDALVYPTMPFPAPDASDPWPDVRTPLGFGNWTGLPEVSVPAGADAQGFPLGNLSFVGLPGSDSRLLALAHAYERQSRRLVIAS